MQLHVVLIEPEIPQNTGNVARTCAATGAELHLVHPLGFSVDDSAVKRAGLDYWDLLTIHEYPSLNHFLLAHSTSCLYLFSARGVRIHSDVSYARESFLLFGRETTGLPDALINTRTADTVRVPVRPGARCLNLSNAVAIATFEALRQHSYPGLARLREYSAPQCNQNMFGDV